MKGLLTTSSVTTPASPKCPLCTVKCYPRWNVVRKFQAMRFISAWYQADTGVLTRSGRDNVSAVRLVRVTPSRQRKVPRRVSLRYMAHSATDFALCLLSSHCADCATCLWQREILDLQHRQDLSWRHAHVQGGRAAHQMHPVCPSTCVAGRNLGGSLDVDIAR
jgi:hypothetical protein